MKAAASAMLGVLLAVLALTAAPTASAHAVRIATDPAVDATLPTGPAHVSATFNEHLQTTFAAMTVVGPDQNLWSTGQPRVDGAVISIDVMPLGPAGTYTVNYRVTSADGHVVSGSWPFHLTTAGTGRPGPPAAAASSPAGGIPVWPFLAVAVVLAVGGAWWAVRRRPGGRRSR
jgi:methionine-rich copper-binding protein CopC